MLTNQQDVESIQVVKEITCTVLKTLSVGNIEEKRISIIFFQNYFKHVVQERSGSYPLYNMFNMINLLDVSLMGYDTWHSAMLMNRREVEYFVDTSTELFSTHQRSHQSWPVVPRKWIDKILTVLLCTSLQPEQKVENLEKRHQEKLNQTLMALLQKLKPELMHTGYGVMKFVCRVTDVPQNVAQQKR